jgi:predicted ester cyclase
LNENRLLVKQYIKAYESGEQKNINAFLHPSYMYYPPGGGEPLALAARIRDEAFFFSAFSNIKIAVEDTVSEDDKVACRITMKCTYTGSYQGIAATNRRITINYMEIFQFKDGKIVGEWAEFDMFSILNQLK